MILVHRHPNEFCRLEMQLISPTINITFTPHHKYCSALLIAYLCVVLLILFRTSWNILLSPLLVNELNNIFDMCSFYVCMRIMIINSFETWPLRGSRTIGKFFLCLSDNSSVPPPLFSGTLCAYYQRLDYHYPQSPLCIQGPMIVHPLTKGHNIWDSTFSTGKEYEEIEKFHIFSTFPHGSL